MLSEDANFKQKGRARRHDGKDPPLGPGWATFVNPQPYHEFIAANTHETEVPAFIVYGKRFSVFDRSATASHFRRLQMQTISMPKALGLQESVQSAALIMNTFVQMA